MEQTPAVNAVPLVRCWRMRAMALIGATIIASSASPTLAAVEPSSRLVHCGEESCVQISGHRDDPAVVVSVNGHAVSVEGDQRWKARLPVHVVREWSAGSAQTIQVALHDPETRNATVASVDLPIGLLGRMTDLSAMVISVH